MSCGAADATPGAGGRGPLITPTATGTGDVELRDGSEIRIRPIRPADRPLLSDAFERLSPESRYRRFLTPVKRLTAGQLAYFTEVDHSDHEALVALAPTGELIGVARYIRLAERPEAAEVAVAVVDDWQARGVATELLGRLVSRAREEGIGRFTATCLAENHDVIELLEQLGATSFDHPAAGLFGLEIELPERLAGHGLQHALRGAARGDLEFEPPV